MRRALLWAIMGVAAAALVLADLGTIVLTQSAARDRARKDLVEQADAFATASIGSTEQARTLKLVRRVARAQGAKLVSVSADGAFVGALPQELSPDVLTSDKLSNGKTVSTRDSSFALAFAAVVATVVSRRISRHLKEAVDSTHRMNHQCR